MRAPLVHPLLGVVVTHLDLRDFLMNSTDKTTAYNQAIEAIWQLLVRVGRVRALCLTCELPRGDGPVSLTGVCRCLGQGTESARAPGTWVYYSKPQRWAISKRSLLELTPADLTALTPATRRRVAAWLAYLH